MESWQSKGLSSCQRGVATGRARRKDVWWLQAGTTGSQRAVQFESFHQRPGGNCESPADQTYRSHKGSCVAETHTVIGSHLGHLVNRAWLKRKERKGKHFNTAKCKVAQEEKSTQPDWKRAAPSRIFPKPNLFRGWSST